jgi:uncharacterized protein YecT (DUF1311 family)
MNPRLTFNRSSFQTTGSCLLFGLLLLTAALMANSDVPGSGKPKENAENSGAPDVSYPLDEFLDQCLAEPNHGSTAGQVECTNQARQRWDDEMNQDYRRLVDQLELKTQPLLRDSQRRWLRYRDADQLLIDAVYELTQGTMFAPMQAYSRLRLVRERSLMLKTYFNVLTNPKARKDLPRAGREKERPENTGSLEVDYAIDDSLDHCIDQHATPSEQATCVEEALGRWDEAMNAVYQKLTERLSAKSTLVDAQRTWLAFRDAEYLLIDSIYAALPGPEYQPLHAYWRLRLTRERALLLKKYLALARSGESTN